MECKAEIDVAYLTSGGNTVKIRGIKLDVSPCFRVMDEIPLSVIAPGMIRGTVKEPGHGLREPTVTVIGIRER